MKKTKECIDAQKVYDWVVKEESDKLVGVDGWKFMKWDHDPCANDTGPFFDVECCISTGERTNSKCFEDPKSPRQDVYVTMPDGKKQTLQLVTIIKKVEVVLSFKRKKPGYGIEHYCATKVIQFPPEQLLLCAPEGTDVVCTILPSSQCFAFNEKCVTNEEKGFQIDLKLEVCQSIQVQANVKIEVDAKRCEPREILPLSAACHDGIQAEECKDVFPNREGKCDEENDEDW
ncbi:BMQ_0737 family morphogenetic spore coat protein [Pontibacillus litoralis]|nr:hypothetical protein [Pontibacillus litoralis]